MTDDRPAHTVAVAAVALNDAGRILVLRRADTGAWELPGGAVETDEDLVDAVRREVAEETDVEVEPGPLTGAYKNGRTGVVVLVFRCEASTTSTRPANHEATETRWVAPDEARGLLAKDLAVWLDDALVSSGAVTRRQEGFEVGSQEARTG